MIDISTHRTILLQILKDIYTDTSIATYLGFKGETACLLFYELDRFSVDLDFDLLDTKQKDFVFNRIDKILLKYGTLKEKLQKRYSLFFLLDYSGRKGNSPNIKVEINTRNFGAKYEVLSLLGISMKVMVKEDLLANKLVAMFERINKATRDIYDVYFFLNKRWNVNKNIIEQRTKLKYEDFINKCIALLEKVSNNSLLFGMGELINDKQKIWVKNNLIKETIFLLKLQLSK
ncbi:nucleotidyl transferase AbiEii/AbiGii toxin family protein [Candidatus Ruminimicrobium bovinum]|uniref:nucleotidyl transferase AbiEii/AbiGii toxin family protein n=1 Tax=Candidatus Ruminimicrobium bovinum TaxID=3242779 RepID=UPI0039B90E05